MRSRVSGPLNLLLVACDGFALWAAWVLTGFIRIELNRFLPVVFTSELVSSLFPAAWLVALCWGVTQILCSTYDLTGKRGWLAVSGETIKAVAIAMCLLVLAMFFVTRQMYSRSLLVLFWLVAAVLLIATRQVLLVVIRRVGPAGFADRVAVVGTGVMGRLLAAKISDDGEIRFRGMGFIADADTSAEERRAVGKELLGDINDLEHIINKYQIRRLFVSGSGLSGKAGTALVLLCDRMDVGLERVPDISGLIAERVRMTELGGIPLLSYRAVGFTQWQEAAKRTADVVLAGAGLVLFGPLLLALGGLIRGEGPGGALFLQRRAGRGGKHFALYKLRSMHADAESRRTELAARNEADGHIFKIERDPRVTRIGRFVRRYSLDELPQLWNVLIGDMSLVGPRPLPVDDVTETDSPYSYWLTRRTAVRPGITGLWQVSGRNQLPFQEMVNLDLHYINNWSLMLDLRILLRTLPVVFRGRGAW